MSDEIKELLNKQTRLLSVLTENIALLSVKVGKLEDKLDYRKQVAEERFIPPENSLNRGED